MTVFNWLRKQEFLLKRMLSPQFNKLMSKDINLLILWEFNHIVSNGPFRGMNYISTSNSSSLSPKIIGTYEKELHSLIEEIISSNYQCIIDIGCAEGYYAVGFAYRLKYQSDSHVYAYDTDNMALENLNRLATINSVAEKITSKGYFSHDEFDSFKDKKTLVFCDIEGDEFFLLNPQIAPSLLNYDILVEVHDGGDKSDIIKKELHNRFNKTHYIHIIKYSERNEQDYALITWTTSILQKQRALNEGRKYGLEWMWLKHI